MSTIERYIFRRVFFASASAFLAMLAVVWVTQAVSQIDFATNTAKSATAYLSLMVFLTPQLATLTLPFGVLIGVVNVFNALNSDSELPVVASAGVSRAVILRPIMLVTSLASLIIFFSNNFVEPASNRAMRDIVTEARGDLLTFFVSEGRFVQPEKGLVIYIDKKGSDGQLSGLMISDTREEEVQLSYFARSAIVTELNEVDALAMADGQIHRRDRETQVVSIIRFDTYALSLSQFGSTAGQPTYGLTERDTGYLLNIPNDDRLAQKFPEQVRTELIRRFSEWLIPIVFAFCGLAVAGQPQSHRTSAGLNMIIAFGAGTIYRLAIYYAHSSSKVEPDMAFLMIAIPVFGVAVGLYMYLRGIEFKAHETLLYYVTRWASKFQNWRNAAARSS